MRDLDQIFIPYLLGELSESESSAFEQKYFADPRLFAQLVEAENDLVDNYARGSLAPDLRARFQTHYQADQHRRERARFAEALADRIDLVAEMDSTKARSKLRKSRWTALTSRPAFGWGFAVACLLVVLGFVWFAIEARRLQQELVRNDSERIRQEQRERDLERELADERARADQLGIEVEALRAAEISRQGPTPPVSTILASLILNIGDVRGGALGPSARLVIAPETRQVRVQLNLKDDDYQSFSLTIQSAGGKQIAKRDRLQPKSKRRASLVVIVPADVFANGDYILTLQGVRANGEVEDVSKLLFRVEKK